MNFEQLELPGVSDAPVPVPALSEPEEACRYHRHGHVVHAMWVMTHTFNVRTPLRARLSLKLPPLPPLNLEMRRYDLPRNSFSYKLPVNRFADLCSTLKFDNARVVKQLTAGFGAAIEQHHLESAGSDGRG